MDVFNPGLDWYLDKLERGEPFSFMRLVDGEWGCILGTRSGTISGRQQFTPDLRAAMSDVVQNAHGGDCYLSINPQAKVLREMMPQIERYAAEHAPGTIWHWGKMFHQASLDGRIGDVVRAFKRHKVVVVGPPLLLRLPFADEFIEISPRGCWDDFGQMFERIARVEDAVVSISAGVPARVLVHQLYPLLGAHSWLLDLGSLWDPYCGLASRSLWKGRTFDLGQLEVS